MHGAPRAPTTCRRCGSGPAFVAVEPRRRRGRARRPGARACSPTGRAAGRTAGRRRPGRHGVGSRRRSALVRSASWRTSSSTRSTRARQSVPLVAEAVDLARRDGAHRLEVTGTRTRAASTLGWGSSATARWPRSSGPASGCTSHSRRRTPRRATGSDPRAGRGAAARLHAPGPSGARRHGADVEVERQRVGRRARPPGRRGCSSGACSADGTAPRTPRAPVLAAAVSPTTTCSPSTTMAPSTMRALWRGLAPAPAQRLDLEHLHPVGELDEPPAAGEELGAEVGGDAEGVDVDAQLVDDAGELLDLRRRVELRLVADEVVDPRAGGEPLDDLVPEVEVVADLDGAASTGPGARRAPTPPSGRAW